MTAFRWRRRKRKTHCVVQVRVGAEVQLKRCSRFSCRLQRSCLYTGREGREWGNTPPSSLSVHNLWVNKEKKNTHTQTQIAFKAHYAFKPWFYKQEKKSLVLRHFPQFKSVQAESAVCRAAVKELRLRKKTRS